MMAIAQIQKILDDFTRQLGIVKSNLQGYNPDDSQWHDIATRYGCISTIDYYSQMSQNYLEGHETWSKIGYTGSVVAATESDVWSYGGSYVFLSAESQAEVLSSDNTADIGSIIFSGTSDGGTTTSLIDTSKDFTAGTPVAAGDCIILDASGATPEWGYVTGITSPTELAVSGGFSSGGTGNGRAYSVIDKSAYTGAHAIRFQYLDGDYAGPKSEIIILNGTTVVASVNTDIFRCNSFRVIATGSGNKPVGNLTLRASADTPVLSYMTAGYTRARNIIYTVPANKYLHVSSGTFGYGYSHNSTHYARIWTRANVDSITGFKTGNIFYPFTEIVESSGTNVREFEIATKLSPKTDIKCSVLADYAGTAVVALRGWLEDV